MPPRAATLDILNAVRRSLRREAAGLGGVKVNNFFLFVALIVAGERGMEPKAAEPLLVLVGALLLLPLSSDPLDRIPRVRMALWPLSPGRRMALRLGGIALAPTLWLAVLGAVLFKTRRPAMGLFVMLAAAAVQLAAPAVRRHGRGGARWPALPGALALLVRANLRQIFSTLDFYLALALALGGAVYRMRTPHPGQDALGILSLLIALALSAYGQCLFGLDAAGSAITRYRLLPMPGRRILLAKDISFLAVLLLLAAPLSVLPCLAFGLTALAVGHYPSVRWRAPLDRWRFSGTKFWMALVQGVGALIAGVGELRAGAGFLAAAALLYGASWYLAGLEWERQMRAAHV